MIEALQQHYLLRQAEHPCERRERSWEAFLALGLPSQRHEDWRYTSIRPLLNLGAPITQRQAPAVHASYADYAAKLVVIDGVYHPHLSEIRRPGISVATTPIDVHLNGVKHPFAHLTAALRVESLTVTIAENQVIDLPIEIIVMATTAAHATSSHIEQSLVLERNSKAEIVVDYRSTATERYWSNISRHITLKSGAELTLNMLQQQALDAVHTEVNHIHPGRDANMNLAALSLGAKLCRVDIDVFFEHQGASCTLLGAYHAQHSQIVDYHMQVTHDAPHCTTEQWVQGIADDKARAVFNGRVKINKHASKSKSLQTNHNLLLSASAEVDTKPELEIDHDDVQCKHGATVGQLDAQALFYLASRGLSEEEAKSLLQWAFMNQLMNRVTQENTAARMRRALAERLPGLVCDEDAC